MKSEHRRELHANELEKLSKAIGKFFEQYGKIVLASLAVVILVVVGVFFFFTWGDKAKEQGSAQLVTATDAKDYLTVADNPDLAGLPYTPAARVRAAELQLKEGLEQYFRDSDAGRRELEQAVKNFETALESEKLPTRPRERALYGLAVATEALSGRDTSAAVQAYRRLLDEYPESIFKEIAESKIKELQTESAKEFYAFLSSQQRKPGDLDTPDDQRLRGFHGGRDVTPAEKPVELPRIPVGLATDLEDPSKKPEKKNHPEKKKQDSAKPFPKLNAPKTNGPKKKEAKSRAKKKEKPAEPNTGEPRPKKK